MRVQVKGRIEEGIAILCLCLFLGLTRKPMFTELYPSDVRPWHEQEMISA